MGEVSIDKLSIEISGNTDKAVKSVDKLTACMERLQKSIVNCKGLNTVSQQIEKLSASAERMQRGKIKELTAYIDKLSNIKTPGFEKLINQIEKLSAATSEISGVKQFSSNISEVVSAVEPLKTVGKNNLSPLIKSLEKIPELVHAIDTTELIEFKKFVEQITDSLKPLLSEVRKSEKGLESLNGIMKSTVAENGNLSSSNAVSVKSYTSLSSILKSVKVKILACSYAMYRLVRSMYGWLKESNDYIENLNLFTVAMGDASEEALDYAKTVSNALGIDMSEWIRNQGVFKQVTTGFGVAAEKSNLMSKNLTQLGYDISSFFNIDTEESMQKLQSGISGEIEPLRRLGYALDMAALQQLAYNLGLNQNINQMTQAQKSQLRYIAIIQQSQNAMGDMARTVATPANSIRILEQQFTQLKRAFGNIVSIVAVKLIPYIQVAVRLLADFANSLAEKWGFEVPEIDYSGMGQGLSTVTDEADDAAQSVQETVKEIQRLAGFDEINVLSSGSAGNASADTSVDGTNDLEIALPEYDFLAGLDGQTEELYQNAKEKVKEFTDKVKSLYDWFKKYKRLIGDLIKLLGLLWVVSKVKKLIDKVKDLYECFKELSIIKTAKKWLDRFKASEADSFFGKLSDVAKNFRDELSPIEKVLGTVVGSAVAGYGSYNLFKDLGSDTLTWKSALADSAEIVGGLAVGIVTTAFMGLAGWIKACKERADEVYGSISYFFDNGGVKVSDITQMFSDQYDQIIDTAGKVSEYKDTISDNDGKIKDAIENVKNFNTAFGDGKKAMSKEDLEYITGQFEAIAQAVKDNVGTATQSILESFSGKIGDVAKDIDIDLGNVIASLKGFESEMKSNVDQAETTVTEYQEKIFKGITPTAEETEEYENAYGYLIDKTRSQSTELTEAKKGLQNAIDFSKLDFQNPEAFGKNMEDLNAKAKEALKAAEDIYKDSSDALEEYNAEIQRQYKYGYLSDDQYNLAMETYRDTKKLIEANLEQDKKDIETDLATLTGAMQDQLNKAIDDQANIMAELQYKANGKNVEQVKIYNKESWDLTLEDEKKHTKRTFSEFQDQIDSATKDLDISPDIETGKSWLKQMSKNEKLSLPSVIKEENGYMDLINENREKSLKSSAEKLAGSFVPASVRTDFLNTIQNHSKKIVDTYNSELKKGEEPVRQSGQAMGYSSIAGMVSGFASGDTLAFAAVNGVMESVKLAAGQTNLSEQANWVLETYGTGLEIGKPSLIEKLTGIGDNVSSALNIDLTENGKSIANTLAKGLSDGSVSIIDIYNGILGKSEEFSIQMMNAYNDAVPKYRKMFSTVSKMTGIGAFDVAGNMIIDFIDHTAVGRRIAGLSQIAGFASGGFPDEGQLFIANESGPEMVGKIGGRTAVANNGQITDAIYNAVLSAMAASGNGGANAQGDIYVYIDSDEVAARVERRQYTRAKRIGG